MIKMKIHHKGKHGSWRWKLINTGTIHYEDKNSQWNKRFISKIKNYQQEKNIIKMTIHIQNKFPNPKKCPNQGKISWLRWHVQIGKQIHS